MSRKVRTDFRKEFPQLCATQPVVAPLSFSHIKDIVEPTPVVVKTLAHGWVDLRNPETYQNVTFRPSLSNHHLMCIAIGKMRQRWIAYNIDNDIDERYDEEPEYEYDETESETDSMSAEDPEYESDF